MQSSALLHGLGETHARTIKAGEEIVFTYSESVPAKERKETLMMNWGFRCACEACLDSKLEAKMELVDKLDLRLYDEVSNGETAKCLKIGEQLIKLYDELQNSDRFYARTYFDLYQATIQNDAFYDLACKFIKKSYEATLAYYGYEHKTVISNRAMMENPRSHPAMMGR